MARRSQDSERPARRRRSSKTREQAEGVVRAADSAKDTTQQTASSAKDAGEQAAGTAGRAASGGQAATAQAASEIAEGALEATRNVATTALTAAKDTLNDSDRDREGLIRQVLLAAREAAGEVLEREARAAASQAAEILTARGPEIAREQLEKRGGSNAAARAALEYGRSRLQGAGGTKALTSAAVGALKESSEGLKTKVTDALSGEDDEGDDGGGNSRLPVEVALDIGVPREVVWQEWTQFEDSPSSLHRIQSTDDGTLTVSAKVWGSSKDEEAEITEQVEPERLAWRADGAIPYRGVVSLHALDENLTRLLVTLEFEPQGLLARVGNPARVIQRGVEADVRRFKADLETRAGEDDGADRLEQGSDGDEPAAEEPPEVEGEVVYELEDSDEASELDDEPDDADVYDEEDEEDEEATDSAETESDVEDETTDSGETELDEDEDEDEDGDEEPVDSAETETETEPEPESDEDDQDEPAAEAEADEPPAPRRRQPSSRSGSSRAAKKPSSGSASAQGRSGSAAKRSSSGRKTGSAAAKSGSGRASSAKSSAGKSGSGSGRGAAGSRRRPAANKG